LPFIVINSDNIFLCYRLNWRTRASNSRNWKMRTNSSNMKCNNVKRKMLKCWGIYCENDMESLFFVTKNLYFETIALDLSINFNQKCTIFIEQNIYNCFTSQKKRRQENRTCSKLYITQSKITNLTSWYIYKNNTFFFLYTFSSFLLHFFFFFVFSIDSILSSNEPVQS
jgi:hypothetical protein